jgi:hypothetical protein
MQTNLIQTVPAGALIKPWIILGPFNIDFSDRVVGLTYFEPQVTPSQVGYSAIEEILSEAKELLTSQPIWALHYWPRSLSQNSPVSIPGVF